MKAMLAGNVEPYVAGYNVFQTNRFSSSTYVMQGPFAETGRNPLSTPLRPRMTSLPRTRTR